MATKDIIVIGSSAGGIDALQRLCAVLPADLPAAVFVVQHISPSARSVLPDLLTRAGKLPALTPVDGQSIEPGHIYVAGPDRHLLLRPGRILMRRGPHENRTRPAANSLFRSAAIAYGGRVIGVVLTGLLDDGADGLSLIKAAGGTAIVQDPDDAEWPSMPRSAIRRDHIDTIAPLSGMAAALTRLTREPANPTIPLAADLIVEDQMAAQEIPMAHADAATPGRASPIACPDCGGVLNELASPDGPRFRCQIGHAFTPLGLAEAQNVELERALGVAMRTHRDRIKLFHKMRDSASTRGLVHSMARWSEAAAESEAMVAVLENAITAIRRPASEGVG